MDKHPLSSLPVIRISQSSTDYGDHAHPGSSGDRTLDRGTRSPSGRLPASPTGARKPSDSVHACPWPMGRSGCPR